MSLPEVPRPWNPAYHDTWEAMTPRERQRSALFDVLLTCFVLGLLAVLSEVFP